ncbi:MAG TPA: DUF4332 domain-containing protein [Promineifilum sp.]
MKYLIALLTAATGILHLLVGFNVIPGSGSTSTAWLLVLNGVGYLVLLVLFWTGGGGRGMIRWILLAYTLITLVGYFIIGAGFSGGTIPLVIKAIELLLIILLLLYREPAAVPATTMATRTSTAGTSVGGMAGSAAAGTSAAVTGAAAGAMAMGTSAMDKVDDTMDAAGDAVMDTADEMGEAAGDAMDSVGDMGEAAVDATKEMADDVMDAGEGAMDAAGETISDAGAAMAAGTAAVAGAVMDKAEEGGDAMGDMADDMMDAGDEAMRGAEMAGADAAEMSDEEDETDFRADLEEYLRSYGSSSDFRKEIEYIEGIGAAYGQKLRAININTVMDLVVNGATRRGRREISDKSGIAQSLILTWVNHVDLFRIKGVAQEYADLLEQSGVDTVVELAHRNPANLFKRMEEVNEQKKLVRRTPRAADVESWVEQAKTLRRVVHH